MSGCEAFGAFNALVVCVYPLRSVEIKTDSFFLISAAQVDGKVASQIVNLDVEHRWQL